MDKQPAPGVHVIHENVDSRSLSERGWHCWADDVEHFHRAGCRDIFVGTHIVVCGKYDLHLNHGTLLESLEHRVAVVFLAIQIASLGCGLFNSMEKFRDRGGLLIAR